MANGNAYGLSNEILDLIVSVGVSATEDMEALRSGAHTEESLLHACLDGADDDAVGLWREYVARMVAVAA